MTQSDKHDNTFSPEKRNLLEIALQEGGGIDIEIYERRKNQEFIGNPFTLPTPSSEDKERLEQYGVIFHAQVDNDPYFQYVTLPEDWSKQEVQGHNHQSQLIDEQGNVLAKMFYKAVPYDYFAKIELIE